jgi:CRISPR/Cas system-associated exonuclease Cas4 (RecB family)
LHWSKSRHVSYKRCPRQFFYGAIAAPQNPTIAALEDREAPPLLRHSVVRDTILGLVEGRGGEAPDFASLMEGAGEILAKGIKDEAQIAGQLTIVEQCVKAFIERELPDIRKAKVVYISTGEPVEFAYGGLTMMVAPEVVLERETALEILSYKTSASDRRKGGEAQLRAGGLVAWALAVLKSFEKPVQVTEVYLREDCARVETRLSDAALEAFVTDAKETSKAYSQSAKIRDFPAVPDASGCRFCNFTSICPDWQDFAEVTFDLAALRESAAEKKPAVVQPRDKRDVFLCHVSEDKEAVVRPMYRALEASGISAWFSEAEMLLGDPIVKKLQNGLRDSRFLVCFLSEAVAGRGWPEAEVESALAAEYSSGEPRVLPIMIGDPEPILTEYPLFRGKIYAKWSDGPQSLVADIQRVLERARRK